MKAINIEWDIDKEDGDVSLPNEIEIPDGFLDDCDGYDEMEEKISDYISDTTGFCHKGFDIGPEEISAEQER